MERLVRNRSLRSQRREDVYRLVVRTEESSGLVSSQAVLLCSLLVRSLVVMDDDVGALEVLGHSLLGIGSQTLQSLQRHTPLHLRLSTDLYVGSLLVEGNEPLLSRLDILLVILKE